LEQLGNPGRLAECQLRLAQVWFQLGRFREAGLLLNALEESANRHGLESLGFEATLAQAYCLLGEKRIEESQELVSKALELIEDSPARPNPVFLKRAMGIALWQLKRSDALQYLQETLAGFRELAMPIEESTTLALLGDYYADSKPDLAVSLWQDALSKIKTGAPEAQIHILVRLAKSADDEGDTRGALTYYHEAIQLQRANTLDFWQPSLFSFYLTQVSADLAQALQLCHKHRFDEEAVLFMECMKAQTFMQHLKRGDHLVALSEQDRVNHLRQEIDKQRGDLPSIGGDGDWLLKLARSREGYENLDKLVGELEQLYSRLEREAADKQDPLGSLSGFNLEAFRRQANRRLGQNWLALDYYVDDEEIFISALSPDQSWFTAQKITPRLKMALGAASQVSPSSGGPTQNDLFVLSEHLLPANIQEQFINEVTLILSPHRGLWSVPWAGLPLRKHDKQLIDLCVPVAVPSLESLSLLWKRSISRKDRGAIKGAFVGVAQFGGRQVELPHVEEEFSYMEQLSNLRLKSLLNKQATREEFAQLFLPETGERQQAHFDFLHIASHIQYDPRTNHLCNLRLSDGVLWSDEFGAFHNFPALVYFSACNGASSFVYEGGEQVGLPITCLVRGANAVVGSRFAVTDEAAFNLTKRFYHHLIQGKRTVAKALALAQQELRDQGTIITDWASFICMGIPDIGFSA
jgi:tetratricopeptide (TPR) repeat protein